MQFNKQKQQYNEKYVINNTLIISKDSTKILVVSLVASIIKHDLHDLHDCYIHQASITCTAYAQKTP